MSKIQSILPLIVLASLFFAEGLFAFGKNKVQYRSHRWYYIQSKNFDFYFYDHGQQVAEFAATVAEQAYQRIQRDFQWRIQKRIVFIIYNSQNDWQQTNVVNPYLEEGVTGLTELLKNRIVIRFNGRHEEFRQLVVHELTHAVFFDMVYGGSVQALIKGEISRTPAWFEEGLAEFEAKGWSSELDMLIRDAVVNDYLPFLSRLRGPLAYHGGAAFFRFIADTYGRKKISELLHNLRKNVGFRRILITTLGIGMAELSRQWQLYLKKQYWPEVAHRKEVDEFARPLSNHRLLRNFLNISPAISPRGDQMAFISDRNGYQNIYLMTTSDRLIRKTLVKGQHSNRFEELHFLRPGMSFSPDGEFIALASKSDEADALNIVNIQTGDIQTHRFALDGIYSTAWSPDGKRIALVGNNRAQSDLYLFYLDEKRLEQLTNDIFSDDHPAWSSDGRYLLFDSDRKDYLYPEQIPPDFRMARFDYEHRDIYRLNLQTGSVERLTYSEWDDYQPLPSPDGEKIAFLSDRNGISNLHIAELNSGNTYAVTDVMSGIYQINWDARAQNLVFSTFSGGGFDIYLIRNPLKLTPVTTENTHYRTRLAAQEIPVYSRHWQPREDDSRKKHGRPGPQNPLQGALATRMAGFSPSLPETTAPVLAKSEYQNAEGKYRVHEYHPQLSPDLLTANARIHPYLGLEGQASFSFSDLLGDKRIIFDVNLYSRLKNTGLRVHYYNLKHRLNLGIGGYLSTWSFDDPEVHEKRYRHYGLELSGNYPFNRFRRVEGRVNWKNVLVEEVRGLDPNQLVSSFLVGLGYIQDNVIWRGSSPVDGTRAKLSLLISPGIAQSSRVFHTLSFDYRKYVRLSRGYSITARLAGGGSSGNDPEIFYLGGMESWINRKFNGPRRTNSVRDLYYSRFITPLRGSIYYARTGNRYLLSNLEFKFPLIQFLGIGVPPIQLFNVEGTIFYDIGSAWTAENGHLFTKNWRGTEKDHLGRRRFRDIVSGYGMGAKIYLLFILLRIDVAWNYDLQRSAKPVWYFTLGTGL